MAEVPFRPVRQLSEYKGKGASASREVTDQILKKLSSCEWLLLRDVMIEILKEEMDLVNNFRGKLFMDL